MFRCYIQNLLLYLNRRKYIYECLKKIIKKNHFYRHFYKKIYGFIKCIKYIGMPMAQQVVGKPTKCSQDFRGFVYIPFVPNFSQLTHNLRR